MRAGPLRLSGRYEEDPMTMRRLFEILSLVAGPALAVLAAGPGAAPAAAPPRLVEVVVDGGYRPDRIAATAGEPLRLRFVRRDEGDCTRVVVFPALGIRRELPTGTPVVIELPPLRAGVVEFHCGMEMIRGRLEVRPRR